MSLSPTPTRETLSAISAGSTPLARHFAAFIIRLAEKPSPELSLAASLVSRRTSDGHTCVNLSSVAATSLPLTDDDFAATDAATRYPELSVWRSRLLESGVVGRPGDVAPLILDAADRLYLQRYWKYEDIIAGWFHERNRRMPAVFDKKNLGKSLARLFPPSPEGETDWQKVAALAAILKKYAVISGGPGTGKTSTVARILAVVCELSETMPTILLAAPTGKAAARLQDAINAARSQLDTSLEILKKIPENATTIHRLLKVRSGKFYHNAERPLPADLVVVDEASMIDLPLMAALLQALPDSAKLILLGDHNQLASVEPGSVLGDICAPCALSGFSRKFTLLAREFAQGLPEGCADLPGTTVSDALVELKKSFRFTEESGIRQAGNAIRAGDEQALIEILGDERYGDIIWRPLPEPTLLAGYLNGKLEQEQLGFLTASSADEAFAGLAEFRILCALRNGPYGVAAINSQVENILAATGRIARSTSKASQDLPEFYHGRPVMITTNDYRANLFNGDTGIILPDPADENRLRAFFQDTGHTTRSFSPHRLPPHETVHAMTVHKSQGSEFTRILLILPPAFSPVLSRELLYTALSRAKEAVEVWADEAILRATVSTRSRRDSGLGDALWPQ